MPKKLTGYVMAWPSQGSLGSRGKRAARTDDLLVKRAEDEEKPSFEQLFQEEAWKTQSRICCISPLFGHKPSYTEPYRIGLLIGIIKSRYKI